MHTIKRLLQARIDIWFWNICPACRNRADIPICNVCSGEAEYPLHTITKRIYWNTYRDEIKARKDKSR